MELKKTLEARDLLADSLRRQLAMSKAETASWREQIQDTGGSIRSTIADSFVTCNDHVNSFIIHVDHIHQEDMEREAQFEYTEPLPSTHRPQLPILEPVEEGGGGTGMFFFPDQKKKPLPN